MSNSTTAPKMKSAEEYPRLWLFDPSRRVYPPAEKGRLWASSGPIWREHWREHKIVGETRVSWITQYGKRVPKKGGPGIAFSEHELNELQWREENRHTIARAVSELKDVAVLRHIAALVGIPSATTKTINDV